MLRKFGIRSADERFRVDPSTAKRWWVFGAAATALVPLGIALDRYSQLDIDALLLYGALLAAAYAGYQAYRARLNSLMPMLIVHHSAFVPLDPYAEDVLKLGQHTRTEMARDDIGLSVTLENIGPGPALMCAFKGWLESLDRGVSPFADVDPGQASALKAGPPHFQKDLAGVGANASAHDSPWLQPEPVTYSGTLVGGFRLHWELSYSDVFGRKYTVWGLVFFVSPIGAETPVVTVEDQAGAVHAG